MAKKTALYDTHVALGGKIVDLRGMRSQCSTEVYS